MFKSFKNIFAKPQNKEIIIHIGPGKTGTSVIQNWCTNNRHFLKRKDINYPKHNLDRNGVSGGHQFLLFSRVQNEWILDTEKVKNFKIKLDKTKCKTTLISSELFWMHLDDLIVLFPGAKFIFYIRSALEFFESSYNQTVKRHNVSIKIDERFKMFNPQPYGIDALLTARGKYGKERFIIKLYDRASFVNGNILFDFLNIFKLTSFPKEIKKDINPSYCFEALEFKRQTNKLNLDKPDDKQLDLILQSYPNGNVDYSIIEPIKFKELKDKVLITLSKILVELDFSESDIKTYLANIADIEQKQYFKQQLDTVQINEIYNFIKEKNSDLFSKLVKLRSENLT